MKKEKLADGKVAEAPGTFQEIHRLLKKWPTRHRPFAPMVAQVEQNQQDESNPPTLETAARLVLETVRHIGRLSELSAKFPDQFKVVARQMPAWPVMQFKRGGVSDVFGHALQRLQLADDYPLDTSSGARSHPSSATGQYLSRWVVRIHCFKLDALEARLGARPASGSSAIDLFNGSLPDGTNELCGELESLLQLVTQMPPLTKATSHEWSRRVLVPLIMLSDAGSDEASCKEPALKAIWRQSGVKSVATFRSRLLTKVRQTLRSLAKPS